MVPTVNVFIEIRSGHDNWQWVTPWPANAEMVYTRYELLRVVRTYGVWGSRLANGSHIRVTAQERFSYRWCAEWQWFDHQPIGEPWVHWPAWENLCFAAQLHIPRYVEHDDHRLIESGATDVRTLRLQPVADDIPMPVTVPHVRDKEDVPYEGALPNLYGETRGRFPA